VVVDCEDVEAVSAFWAGALGYEIVRRWQDALGLACVELHGPVPAFGRPQLLFQEVDEAKAAKNRMHVDVVVPAGQAPEAEVERLVELGGRIVSDDPHRPWVVLADPEGNEFCLRTGPRT
jgi:catechol 2,3-dioxygenase-like lactoylglutathione lyase family enzyme